MKVIQSTKKLTDDDGNVLFSEDARFHLVVYSVTTFGPVGDHTRSEHEPPEQYLYTHVSNEATPQHANILHDYPEVGSLEK